MGYVYVGTHCIGSFVGESQILFQITRDFFYKIKKQHIMVASQK